MWPHMLLPSGDMPRTAPGPAGGRSMVGVEVVAVVVVVGVGRGRALMRMRREV